MNEIYMELHKVARHGQKQGFVAGVIFSAAAYGVTRWANRRATEHIS